MTKLPWSLGALAGAVAVVVSQSGCLSSTATPAVHGKAYIVTNTIFTGAMYHCDANNGEPTCWRVVERAPVAR